MDQHGAHVVGLAPAKGSSKQGRRSTPSQITPRDVPSLGQDFLPVGDADFLRLDPSFFYFPSTANSIWEDGPLPSDTWLLIPPGRTAFLLNLPLS